MIEYLNSVIQGDNIEVMKKFPDNSIDLCLTDPPYGISMADWDHNLPPKETWEECNRILKPGAFCLVMIGTRQDLLWRLLRDIEESNFNISLPSFYWVYAQGVGKGTALKNPYNRRRIKNPELPEIDLENLYTPNCFKTSVEIVIFAQKKISEKTYLDQYLRRGNGVIRRAEGRIPSKSLTKPYREPSNLFVQDDALNDGQIRKSGIIEPNKHRRNKTNDKNYRGVVYGSFNLENKPLNTSIGDSGSFSRYFDLDAWWEVAQKNIPPKLLDLLPIIIASKPSTSEKRKGLPPKTQRNSRTKGMLYTSEDNFLKQKDPWDHPTVKPLKLLTMLISLTSKVGDIVLDPFAGSGTTAISSILKGRNYIAIEKEENYVKIILEKLKFYEENKGKNTM